MSRQAHKLTTIKGCSIWALENDLPVSETPNADNVTITLPEVTFSTTDVNILGSLSVPDFTRLDNFTVTANIAVDNPDSAALKRIGLQSWRINYVVGLLDPATGLESYTPHTVYVTGYVGAIPLSSVEQGGDGMADISMNCVAVKKLTYSTVDFDIDRLKGKIMIDGRDYSQDIDSLY